MFLSCAPNAKEFERYFEEIKGYIEAKKASNEVTFLSEVSINRYSPLHDLIDFPFEHQKDQELAAAISYRLLPYLFLEMRALLSKDMVQGILCSRSKGGFMLLQQALASGNPGIVAMFLKALKALEDYPEALNLNCINKTKDGFMLLEEALASSSSQTVNRILKRGDPEALKNNLKNRTEDGAVPLQNAVNSNTKCNTMKK